MSIAKLKLDESVKLEFGVSITGATNKPDIRFVIETKDFNISYPCKKTQDGIEVEIGNLKNVIPAGEYPVRLEAILDNKLYVPMQESIVFEPGVEILTMPQINQVKESIKVETVSINKIEKETKKDDIIETKQELLKIEKEQIERKLLEEETSRREIEANKYMDLYEDYRKKGLIKESALCLKLSSAIRSDNKKLIESYKKELNKKNLTGEKNVLMV